MVIGYSGHRKGTVQHTGSRGHLVRGCVCPVGMHCLHATVTASPGLCTTAEQIFVRSGANRQGQGWGVGEPGCKGQARPRGLDPFTFTGSPWKYSGTNASEAFPALSTRGPQGIRTIAWSSCFQQTGPSPSPDSGEGPVPSGLPWGAWCGVPTTYTAVSCSCSRHSPQTACPALCTVPCPCGVSFSAHPGSVISRAPAPDCWPAPLSLNDWQAHQAGIIIRLGTEYFHSL